MAFNVIYAVISIIYAAYAAWGLSLHLSLHLYSAYTIFIGFLMVASLFVGVAVLTKSKIGWFSAIVWNAFNVGFSALKVLSHVFGNGVMHIFGETVIHFLMPSIAGLVFYVFALRYYIKNKDNFGH